MEHLLADNDGLATSTSLLNATTELERKLTARAAQDFIKVLVKQKWLEPVVSEEGEVKVVVLIHGVAAHCDKRVHLIVHVDSCVVSEL